MRKDNIRFGSVILMQRSPVSELMHDEITVKGRKVHLYNNDVTLLFNQERLAKQVGVDTVNAWLNSLSSSYDGLADIKKKMSDEQLMSFVKSRHIQSLSDLQYWIDYIDETMSKELKDFEASQAVDVSDHGSTVVESSNSE